MLIEVDYPVLYAETVEDGKGQVACMRCPQVIKENYNQFELMRLVATLNVM